MARLALYGSQTNSQSSSTKVNISDSFLVAKQSRDPDISLGSMKPSTPNTSDNSFRNKTIPKNAYIDYDGLVGDSIYTIRDKLQKTLGYDDLSHHALINQYIKYYNRFKLPTLNDTFSKGFAHVFFTRPDCNILNETGKDLSTSFKNDAEFKYVFKNDPELVKQLSLSNGQNHNFMLYLSNKASSFSLNDEFIQTDNYGKTYKGWQVSYGRHNIESKSAGDFNITYTDDRNLSVYRLHRLWTDYISDVYLGKKAPKEEYIKARILDYASACYYFITAEDGETVLFWSKYYGVFPSTIPSNQYGWAVGNVIEKPSIDIKYQYSFKEDFNPEALVEFNMNGDVDGSVKYVPIYDAKLGHVGTTWVGSPYVELVTNNTDPECPYTFKLRFRQPL